MKKSIITLFIFSSLISVFSFQTAFAQDTSGLQMGTLLPVTKDKDCNSLLDQIENASTETSPEVVFKKFDNDMKNNVLACAIMTGKIHLWMIPFYVVYLIEFMIGIAGLLSVLFLVMAGFQYVSSGLSEAKDKAKNTIKHALMGLGVALAAWTVVNIVQYIVTL
jgi:hypothetical protein